MPDAPVPEIHWCMTVYVPAQDRLRLSCSLKTGDTDVFWLTQRLANALIKNLLNWLDKQTVQDERFADIDHRMAQQSAVSKVPPKPAKTIPDSPGWLAHSIAAQPTRHGLQLTFKDDGERALSIRFDAQHLRRWLKVLYAQYRRAEWATDIWPAWMTDTPVEGAGVEAGMLH